MGFSDNDFRKQQLFFVHILNMISSKGQDTFLIVYIFSTFWKKDVPAQLEFPPLFK
jgi:exo-beta-1,3-glucanase (GH17 family)